MDHESPELIEQQMQQTRASLSEKVSALESQVMGTFQHATQAVNSTVDSISSTVESVKAAVHDMSSTVKDTVSDSVHSVTDQMKTTFDLAHHTREHPWPMVGGATAVGLFTGLLLFGRTTHQVPSARPAAGGSFDGLATAGPSLSPVAAPAYAAPPPAPPAAPRRPGWLDELIEKAGQEVKKIGELALASATASLRQTVQQEVPKLIETGIPHLIQSFTDRSAARHDRSNDAAYSPPPNAARVPHGGDSM